jgi:two-component system, LytTR family, response regulator
MVNLKPTTIIVEDEVHAAQLLQKLLEPFPLFGTVSIITNASVAFTEIIEQQPRFLFLDIQMPGISGLQLAEKLKPHIPETKIIYVTAFENYALEALRQNAFDYLLKPVDKAELLRVVEKLIGVHEVPVPVLKNRHLLIRNEEGVYQVSEDDIVYLEADSSYTNLTLRNHTKILASSNLGKLLLQLSSTKFLRISRKHLVNRSYITFYHSKMKYLLLNTPEKEYRLKVMLKVNEMKNLLTL